MKANKLERLNLAYKKALGRLLLEMFPGEIIGIRDVLVDDSYRNARVWLRATPETLQLVISHRPRIQREIGRYLKTRFTIRFEFLPDDQYLDHMDELFQKVEEDEN